MVSQVDASGVACTNGGGTIVLESHGTVFGPGGQYVSSLLKNIKLLILILHRGVFTDPSLGPILYYHYVDTTIGYADSQKRFGWNKINFSSGWPVV
jgi:arabinan endo-1,5-alpha-L-arabinosidase